MEDDFETNYQDFETGIAEMVFDGWSDSDIAEEARRLAKSIRDEMSAKIGSAVDPAPSV